MSNINSCLSNCQVNWKSYKIQPCRTIGWNLVKLGKLSRCHVNPSAKEIPSRKAGLCLSRYYLGQWIYRGRCWNWQAGSLEEDQRRDLWMWGKQTWSSLVWEKSMQRTNGGRWLAVDTPKGTANRSLWNKDYSSRKTKLSQTSSRQPDLKSQYE